MDKSIRVWNFQERTLELVKSFAEEAYSIAMHPTGYILLVGFADKLRLLTVLMDDIRYSGRNMFLVVIYLSTY